MDASVISRLLAFIEQTSDLIGVADDAGNVVYVNDATRKRLGLSAGDPIGLTTADLFPESAFARYYDEVRPAILQAGGWSGVIPVRTAGGGSIDSWMTVVGGSRPGGDIAWLVTSGRDVTEWLRDRADLSWQATHDELTGLARRVVLGDRLECALSRARRTGGLVGVLFIDVDDLKAINDGLGHHAGDTVLTEVARRIRGTTRESDTVVRVGGDEFVVIIDGVPHLAEAELLAVRVSDAVSRTLVPTAGAEIRVSVSIGAVAGHGSSDPEMLVREADAAMYKAKRNRTATAAAAQPGAGARAPALSAHTVSVALTQRLIMPHYQPVVDLRSGATVGVQSLARWGTTPSADFVELVAGSGAAVALDLAILRQASSDAVACPGPWAPRVYVHVSAKLLAEASVEWHIGQILARSGLDPGRLAIEIPEPAWVEGGPRSVGTLRALSDLGVRLVISRAEVGQPQAPSLGRGLFAELRFGRALVAASDGDRKRWGALPAAVAVARDLGMVTFAAGVETTGQRQRLVELGCHLGMGYLLGPPQAAPIADGYPGTDLEHSRP